MAFEAIHADEVLAFGRERNLIVSVWRDAPDVARMRMLREYSDRLADTYADQFGHLNLVVSGTPRFSEDVRRETRSFVAEGRSAVVAHVLLLPGFISVAVRSFLNTVMLVARPRVPTKIFSALEPGVAFVADVLVGGSEAWTLEQLQAAAQAGHDFGVGESVVR